MVIAVDKQRGGEKRNPLTGEREFGYGRVKFVSKS